MGTLKIRKQTDGGMNYMANVLDYTVRGHGYEDRVYSPNVDIYDCFNQFYKVKEYFGKTSGNPVYHFIVTYNSGIIKEDNFQKARMFSKNIAAYFADRYQVIYGVHKKTLMHSNKKPVSYYHAHFVINSVSYIDGRMFSGSLSDIYEFLDHVKEVTKDKYWNLIEDYNRPDDFCQDDDSSFV